MRSTLYFKDDDARLSFLLGNYITLTKRAADEEIILHQYSRNLIFDVLERAGDGYGTLGKIWYAIKNTEISLMESKK